MTIYVKVLEGRNLKGNDFFTKADPFIVLSHGEFSQKTRFFDNDENPKFNELLTFNYVKGKPLVFQLWDDNSPKAADLIAEEIVNIDKFFGITHSMLINFKRKNGKAAGEIDVEISLYSCVAHPPGYLAVINPQLQVPIAAADSTPGTEIVSALTQAPAAEDVPCTFRKNRLGGYTEKETAEGRLFVFSISYDHARTVFVDRRIAEGIIVWKVRIRYAKKLFFRKDSKFSLGVAAPPFLAVHDDHCLENGIRPMCYGSCSFQFSYHGEGIYRSEFAGVVDEDGEFRYCAGFGLKDVVVGDESLVTAELDMTTHTLSFFVNEEKVPYAISLIEYPALYLGISVEGTASFTSVSLSRLMHPTPSLVKVCVYRALTKEVYEKKN